ncbi:MAG TPA: RDD family protein [Armatimonadaceae bacterium]|nr:RDD family protein [Armatimonadaceae bacterium]
MVCPQCGTQNENAREDCVRCKRPLHPATMKGKIACSVHANREATTSCGSCGARLCDTCAINYNGIDYCDACAPAEAVRRTFDEDYEKVPVVDPARTPVASFAGRLWAAFIDFGLVLFAIAFLYLILFFLTGSADFVRSARTQPVAFYLFRMIVLIGITAYLIIPHAMTGQTLGKQLTGIIVLQPDGHIVETRTAMIRALVQLLALLPFGLGFFWMLWDPERRTWHDRAADTVVFEYSDPT